MLKACPECNKEFKTKPSRISQGRGKFCSKECAFKNCPTGPEHGNWKNAPKWSYTKEERAAYMREWNKTHRAENYRYYKNRDDRYRQKVYELLGSSCCHCGFSDQRALQIDHKNGGGNKHWATLNKNRTRLYKEIFDSPNEFQILCANCNWIKRFENNEIKHGGPITDS